MRNLLLVTTLTVFTILGCQCIPNSQLPNFNYPKNNKIPDMPKSPNEIEKINEFQPTPLPPPQLEEGMSIEIPQISQKDNNNPISITVTNNQSNKLEGLSAIYKQGGLDVSWSYPVKNSHSKFPATAKVTVTIYSPYTPTIQDITTVLSNPNQPRLASSTLYIPKSQIKYNLKENQDATFLFNKIEWSVQWQ